MTLQRVPRLPSQGRRPPYTASTHRRELRCCEDGSAVHNSKPEKEDRLGKGQPRTGHPGRAVSVDERADGLPKICRRRQRGTGQKQRDRDRDHAEDTGPACRPFSQNKTFAWVNRRKHGWLYQGARPQKPRLRSNGAPSAAGELRLR
jgi:hypothetical protein